MGFFQSGAGLAVIGIIVVVALILTANAASMLYNMLFNKDKDKDKDTTPYKGHIPDNSDDYAANGGRRLKKRLRKIFRL